MIILDATTKSLEFKLLGAVSANELPFIAAWADHSATAFTPGHTDGISNGTTAVTAVAAPAASTQRQLKTLIIFNDDSAAAVVIVQYNNNATIRQLTEISVPANGTLTYTDGEGFRVINSAGEVLAAFDPDVAKVNVAEVITAGWAFTQEIDAQAGVDISGGGLKVGGSTVIDASENIGIAGDITLADDAWMGLGAAKGRIEFDDAAVDEVNVRDALFGVNIATPTGQLHVVSGAAARVGLIVDTAATPSQPVVDLKNNGTSRVDISIADDDTFLRLKTYDNDAGLGPRVMIERNNDGATPAAGHVTMFDKGNQGYAVWPDDSGDLRIHTGNPTNANDGAGIVVGDQSSWHEGKTILGPAISAPDAVRDVAALVFEQFRYNGTGYQQWDGTPPIFNGLVIHDRKDWWGKNMGPHQTPALNELELFARYGLTIQSVISEVQALGGFTWL